MLKMFKVNPVEISLLVGLLSGKCTAASKNDQAEGAAGTYGYVASPHAVPLPVGLPLATPDTMAGIPIAPWKLDAAYNELFPDAAIPAATIHKWQAEPPEVAKYVVATNGDNELQVHPHVLPKGGAPKNQPQFDIFNIPEYVYVIADLLPNDGDPE